MSTHTPDADMEELLEMLEAQLPDQERYFIENLQFFADNLRAGDGQARQHAMRPSVEPEKEP